MKAVASAKIAAAAVAVFRATQARTVAKKARKIEIDKWASETGKYFNYDNDCDDDEATGIKAAFDTHKQTVKTLISARAALRREIMKEVS